MQSCNGITLNFLCSHQDSNANDYFYVNQVWNFLFANNFFSLLPIIRS